MSKDNEKIQNVVKLLSSLGVNIKKTKSRLEVMHTLPITGIPLPFISYGGSSLWSLMCGIGVILSIYYHQSRQYTTQNK